MGPPDMEEAGPRQETGPTPNPTYGDNYSDGHPVVQGHKALVLHRKLSSTIFCGNDRVTRILKKTVPSAFREFDRHDQAHIVYGTRVSALMAAFNAAGVEVAELGRRTAA